MTADSKIEQVARAIARRRAIRLLELSGSDESHLKDFTVIGADLDDARAGIEAMRDPTEAMMDAGAANNFGKPSYAAWQAMIDAALAEDD